LLIAAVNVSLFHRALFPQDELPNEVVAKKMTPRRKVLASKRKKTPKKGGSNQ
jgi:hypothetical protein